MTRLPDFVIGGASKAGTDWLMHCLADHPGVYIPLTEIRYFNYRFARGRQWYASHFSEARAEQVVGEKSPGYLRDAHAPARLRQCFPSGKLIFLLRDPIERAYSHYKMELRAGRVSEDVEGVLQPEHVFVEEGRYHAHLSRYFSHFASDQLLVLLYDYLKQAPAQTLRRVCTFLGIEGDFRSVLTEHAFNVGRQHQPRWPRLYRTLVGATKQVNAAGPAGRAMLSWLRRSPCPALFHRLNAGRAFPTMSAEHQRMLADYYDEDLAALSSWLGRDLSHWLRRYRANISEPEGAFAHA